MKKLSIILACFLVALTACTKSKEVHPELGDGNDEIVTVGINDVHVEYTRTDHAELQKVVFHYGLVETQQFATAEMTKREAFFELTLNDLVSDTLYYYYYYYEVFPYSGNTSITERVTFHTQVMDTPEPPTPPSGAPEGAINGLFTINENGDQVYFSQGNLQYQASTGTWRFATSQWDYVGTQTPDINGYVGGGTVNGSDNLNISQFYDGWIDWFGWGTSGYHDANDPYNANYQPWSTSIIGGNESNFFGYGPSTNMASPNLTGSSANYDWGVYNAISNGGNTTNTWRTLTYEEWSYLFYTRSTTSGNRYAKANVNNINGVIVLPDNWSNNCYTLNNTNNDHASFSSNVINSTTWANSLEAQGAVFLPTTGSRNQSLTFNDGLMGYYWSSSYISPGSAHHVDFNDVALGTYGGSSRPCGLSVRLVQDANH